MEEELAYNGIIHVGQILNMLSFGHDIVQQVIKGCKEICGKKIARKLYFDNNACVLGKIKNRAYK